MHTYQLPEAPPPPESPPPKPPKPPPGNRGRAVRCGIAAALSDWLVAPTTNSGSALRGRQGRRVAVAAYVPRNGLRPFLLLYFAAAATRHPWLETPVLCNRQ